MASGIVTWTATPLNPPFHRYTEGGCKWIFARVTTPSGANSYANSGTPGNANRINAEQIGLTRIYEVYPLTSWNWIATAAVPDAFVLRWNGALQTLELRHFGIADAGVSANGEMQSNENAGGVQYDVLVRGF